MLLTSRSTNLGRLTLSKNGYTWRPANPTKAIKTTTALSLDVVDVATRSTQSVAVDPAFVEAMVGIQSRALKKVQEKPSMDLAPLQATLNTLTDYSGQ